MKDMISQWGIFLYLYWNCPINKSVYWLNMDDLSKSHNNNNNNNYN